MEFVAKVNFDNIIKFNFQLQEILTISKNKNLIKSTFATDSVGYCDVCPQTAAALLRLKDTLTSQLST